MTEPFDVSLKVKLDYQAGGSAKAAVADIEAVRRAATQLATPAAGTLAKELAGIKAQAEGALQVISNIRDAAKRQAAEGQVVAAATGTAKAAVDAFNKEFSKANPGRMFGGVTDGAAQAKREVTALGRSADALTAATGPRGVQRELGAVRDAAAAAKGELQQVRKEADKLGAAGGAGGGGGPPGEGGGHGANGFVRTLERGAAMPFRLERAAALATSAGGAIGLGGGLALYHMQKVLHDATDQAIDFESAMVGVRQAAGNVPDAAVRQLGDTIRATSRSTGAATGELASLTASAMRAGRPLADIPAFLERSAKAARVMGLGVDETGDKLIQLGRTWREDQRGIEDTTDAIALAAQRTGAQPGGVLDFVNRFAGMRERGMSARQTAAFGAGFQASGLGPGEAMSAFGGLTERLAAPQRAGTEFQQRLFALGPGFGPAQLRAGMRSDPTRVVMDFLGAIRKLPENGRGNVLAGMFGPEQGEQIGRVVEHLDDLRRALASVEDQGQRSHALERAFAIFDETTRARIDKAAASLSAFQVQLGKVFAPSVGTAADTLAHALDALTGFLERNERAGIAGAEADKLPQPISPVPKPPIANNGVTSELSDPEVAAERERVRRRTREQLEDLERQKAAGAGGPGIDRQIEAQRRRLAPLEAPQSGLLHRMAYRDDEPSGGLQAVIEAGTKAGVIAGFRELMDGRAARTGAVGGGLINASWETGGASDSLGGGSGEAGSAPRRRSLRYGGGFGPARRRGGRGEADNFSGGPPTALGRTGAAFRGKAPAIMRGLMDRYGLTQEQAAGVVGNLAHESAGFTAYHEGGQAPGKGGVGWAQWTGSRRRKFEAWTGARGLNPTSDEASWRYLTEGDPETPAAIAAVKRQHTAHGAAAAFEQSFERAGVKAYGSRFGFADRAMQLGPAAPGSAVARESAPLSPRFEQPGAAKPKGNEATGPASGGTARPGHAPGGMTVQNFYGQHDPAQTARFAMLEQNREVRRAQARALHSVGRVA